MRHAHHRRLGFFDPPAAVTGEALVGIIGLGYVGLPLAVEFSKKYPVLGFDINAQRILQLKSAHDITLEVSNDELNQAIQLQFTDKLADLEVCNVYIVTVPTPINKHKQPESPEYRTEPMFLSYSSIPLNYFIPLFDK